ncbi:hypothetical protein PRUPE_3G069300 [Prunus persica]|uniref:Uncharacterized protein n=1 Tax=Prunus persica TaxID=3760 RepID=A0A251PZN6_PRUPE|nr:hypothetical protein PRUPE_3G069300 [Prunus persica]ONI15926.1 hypothetical protein PRUPE_3G069300 [Prunus persica]
MSNFNKYSYQSDIQFGILPYKTSWCPDTSYKSTRQTVFQLNRINYISFFLWNRINCISTVIIKDDEILQIT